MTLQSIIHNSRRQNIAIDNIYYSKANILLFLRKEAWLSSSSCFFLLYMDMVRYFFEPAECLISLHTHYNDSPFKSRSTETCFWMILLLRGTDLSDFRMSYYSSQILILNVVTQKKLAFFTWWFLNTLQPRAISVILWTMELGGHNLPVTIIIFCGKLNFTDNSMENRNSFHSHCKICTTFKSFYQHHCECT